MFHSSVKKMHMVLCVVVTVVVAVMHDGRLGARGSGGGVVLSLSRSNREVIIVVIVITIAVTIAIVVAITVITAPS